MKNRLGIPLILASLLVLSGCVAELTPALQQEAKTFDFTLEAELDDFTPADQTKASATSVVRLSWSRGDEISVINLTTGKALGGSLVADADGTITTFSGTLTGTVRNGDQVAFLYPSQGYTQEQDYQPVTIDFSRQGGQSKEQVPICVYAVAGASGNTFSKSTATFKFLMSYIQFSFANLNASDLIEEVTVDDMGSSMTLSLSSTGFVATPSVGTITLSPSAYSVSTKGTKSFYVTFAESPKVSSRKVTVHTSNSLVAGTFSGSKLDASKAYTATVADFKDAYEYVDLGLSVKWATMNVGATRPEEYGGYYQWAGLQDVSSTSIVVDQSNCPYHIGLSDETGWTKYVTSSELEAWSGSGTPDNKLVLDLEDDVAHVNWGGNWRMPTEEEYIELLDNCTWTWTDDYKGTGVSGRIVYSNIPGYTNKYIFLPAAGVRIEGGMTGVGTRGSFWTSSRSFIPATAEYQYITSSREWRYSGINRYLGMPVRPVYGEVVPVSSISLDKSSLEIDNDGDGRLEVTVNPDNATYKTYSWSVSDTSVVSVNPDGYVYAKASGSAIVTCTSADGTKSASCTVTVASIEPVVDLGLSVKWASCNLGASVPEECGDYYAWGEITARNVLTQANYKYSIQDPDTYRYYCTKYCASDGDIVRDEKTVLSLSDDAARVNLGDNWRMPTKEEVLELISKCSVSSAVKNGVSGYLVTGSKGKSIFLPVGGRKSGANLLSTDRGYYWSSSLNYSSGTLSTSATCMYLADGRISTSINTRDMGLLIRPVYDEDATGGIESLSLDRSELDVEEGSTEQLEVFASWAYGCLKKYLDWSSSNPDIASVDNNGVISAHSPGTAIISVKPVYGTTTASCRVTVTEFGNYFAVTALDSYSSVDLSTGGQCVQYRKSGEMWKDWDQSISLNQDETVYFRGHYDVDVSRCNFTFFNGVKLSGNIVSLSVGDSRYDGCCGSYSTLFQGCDAYIDASELILPSDTEPNCYYRMFADCRGLVAAPALPATELSSDCYKFMFLNCTSLAEAPALPATKLADRCYQSMFENCTSLRSAPSLNATTLATMCYASMFKGCSQLYSVPAINGTPSYSYCFDEMFSGCTGLTTAPLLKGPIFGSYSCRRMFYGCTNLVNPPVIFSYLTEYIDDGVVKYIQVNGSNTFEEMFRDCRRLATPMEAPVRTLTASCFKGMYYGCRSLTSAPELLATTLVTNCYQEMFYNCSSLSHVKAAFTSTPGGSFTDNWLYGVSGIGVFEKSADATWDVEGESGIPYGWSVETY